MTLGAARQRFSDIANGMHSALYPLAQVAFVRVKTRLAGALLKLADGNFVPAVHAELAPHIGSAREVVSRRLDVLAKRGLVRLDKGLVTLTDPAALQVFTIKG